MIPREGVESGWRYAWCQRSEGVIPREGVESFALPLDGYERGHRVVIPREGVESTIPQMQKSIIHRFCP